VPTLEELWDTLTVRAASGDSTSRTVELLATGVHGIGKKVVEEAAESWMAAEFEGPERTAEEVAQLLYHALVLLLATGVTLEQVHARL